MRLISGDSAPQFEIDDIYGQPVRLSDFAGQKLLLCFYRYAGCPFSNLFLHDLIDHYGDFMRIGLRVVVFFQSPCAEVLKFPGAQHPMFSVVADHDRRIYDLYGIETSVVGMARTLAHMGVFLRAWEQGFPQRRLSGNFFLMPGEFLIGPDQKIFAAHYNRHVADVLSIKEIIRFVLDLDKVSDGK